MLSITLLCSTQQIVEKLLLLRADLIVIKRTQQKSFHRARSLNYFFIGVPLGIISPICLRI